MENPLPSWASLLLFGVHRGVHIYTTETLTLWKILNAVIFFLCSRILYSRPSWQHCRNVCEDLPIVPHWELCMASQNVTCTHWVMVSLRLRQCVASCVLFSTHQCVPRESKSLNDVNNKNGGVRTLNTEKNTTIFIMRILSRLYDFIDHNLGSVTFANKKIYLCLCKAELRNI
jgi:hypothetical protein